jgi:alkanesulfonate monooxygenase SsuD/methylene tetrahydromethanopterin reductase-like flavin-dependent oxidoreductase (luciferase family)
MAIADPWITLAAIAYATSALRLEPMVTPLSRHRIHKLSEFREV